MLVEVPDTPPVAGAPTVDAALQVAREIAKADEILSELKSLYTIVREALVKIDALEMRVMGVSSQVDGVAITCGALLAKEIAEPEPEEIAEEIAEEVAEEIITELQTEEIPPSANSTPETAPPEEKKTRKRGFF